MPGLVQMFISGLQHVVPAPQMTVPHFWPTTRWNVPFTVPSDFVSVSFLPETLAV